MSSITDEPVPQKGESEPEKISGQRDLTKDNVLATLLTFAAPFFCANLLQALYGAVDLLVVGHYAPIGSPNVSAVSCGSQVFVLVTFVVVGLTTAGTVIVGNFYGAKDFKSVQRTIGTMMTCFLFVTVFMVIVMFLSATPLLKFLQTPAAAFAPARSYILICTTGTLFIVGYNVCAAILRGIGNSLFPMIFVGIACAVNLIADILFVGRFNMGPAGAAYATVISQGVSMICGLFYIQKQKNLFDFKWRNFAIERMIAKKLFVIGLPLSIQSTLIDFSFMLIFSFVNVMGLAASGGYGICCRINGFTMLPAISLSMALTAMVAQNIGAQRYDRAIQSFKWGVICALSIASLCWAWMRFFPESAFGLFTHDQETIQAGADYMRSFCYDVLLVAFVFCANGLLNGSGHTRFTFVNNVVPTFLLRVPAAWYFSRLSGATLHDIGWAAPLASMLSVIITLIYLKTGRWKIKRL